MPTQRLNSLIRIQIPGPPVEHLPLENSAAGNGIFCCRDRTPDEALRKRPNLKVLFTTGYTRNAVVHNGVLDAGVELIGKPFTIEELAAKVREVLDAPMPGS